MKTGFLVLTCALGLGACGGPEAKPANDPASVNTTAAPGENTAIATAPSTGPDSASTNMSSGSGTQTGAASSSKTARPADPYAKAVAPSPVNPAPAPNTNAAQPASGAAVAPNPGVADNTKNATNTKINDRDRHDALTPMDQGGSAAERNITAAIRKGVMGDKSLSFTAKNVKIITNGTKVTLRGPVGSDQERSNIETRAKQTPGVTEVDNQIEVKK